MEQKDLAFLADMGPAFRYNLCGSRPKRRDPQRIFTAIGAKRKNIAFLPL
jgi:hypothetical protein